MPTSSEIYLYGAIGNSLFDEGINAADIVKQIKQVDGKVDTIKIRINSPGGSVNEGLPIITAISEAKSNIETYVDGIAYSMGAMIALAGDEVKMAKQSLMMIHAPMTMAVGNAKELRIEADVLDKYEAATSTIIAAKTKLSDAEVIAKYYAGGDMYFTAAEAVAEGLATSVTGEKARVPKNIRQMGYDQVMSLYNNKEILNSLIKLDDMSTEKVNKEEKSFMKHMKAWFTSDPADEQPGESIKAKLETVEQRLKEQEESRKQLEEKLAAISAEKAEKDKEVEQLKEQVKQNAAATASGERNEQEPAPAGAEAPKSEYEKTIEMLGSAAKSYIKS